MNRESVLSREFHLFVVVLQIHAIIANIIRFIDNWKHFKAKNVRQKQISKECYHSFVLQIERFHNDPATFNELFNCQLICRMNEELLESNNKSIKNILF